MRAVLTPLAALALLAPAALHAGAEITLSSALRQGATTFPVEARTPLAIACFTTPCILAEASTTEDELEPSLIVDVPISERWMFEGLLNRQDGNLRLVSVFPLIDDHTFDLTTAQVGLLRHWGDGRWLPFAAFGVGATRFETNALVYDRPLFPGIVASPVDAEEVLSASLAGGVRAHFGRHVGLRLEARAYRHELPERLGGALDQTEASLGVSYRW